MLASLASWKPVGANRRPSPALSDCIANSFLFPRYLDEHYPPYTQMTARSSLVAWVQCCNAWTTDEALTNPFVFAGCSALGMDQHTSVSSGVWTTISTRSTIVLKHASGWHKPVNRLLMLMALRGIVPH